MKKRRVAIFISGRGSNMQALANACDTPDFPAEVALVLSNRSEAAGLDFARAKGLATLVISHKDYASRDAFDAAIEEALQTAAVEFICLAGFMRLLTDSFVNRWRDKMINIHPSLLPAFKGLETHQRIIDAGARISGCTVHYVRPEMDEGPIIAQAAVPVSPDDTADALAARVLEAEHRLYVYALRMLASGLIRVVNEKVVYSEVGAADGLLISPSIG